jgi:nucleotide-binding universal stress UspA family protein
MANSYHRYVVVGVTPRQPEVVVRQAARFAHHFEARLACANVNPGSYVVAEHPDGSVDSRPIDPDGPDWSTTIFDSDLRSHIDQVAGEEHVQVVFRELAGDVAHALGRLAEVLQAEMIVVGARRGGFRSSVHEFFGGSIGARLAHQQHRPVVVIPLSPVVAGSPLPWEGPE